MLQQRQIELAEPQSAPGAGQGAMSGALQIVPPAHEGGGRYGEKRGLNGTAIAIALGVQLLALPLFWSLGAQALARKEPHVVAVNLTQVQAPPPAEQPEAEPEAEPEQLQDTVTPQPQPVEVTPPRPAIVLAASAPEPAKTPVTDPRPVPAPAAAPAASAAPGMVSADINGIRLLSGQPPRYPVESRRKKEEGTVRLRVMLGTDGKVETISVASSSGFPRLDKAALDAVRRWRWTPTLRGGEPVKVLGELEFPFVLS